MGPDLTFGLEARPVFLYTLKLDLPPVAISRAAFRGPSFASDPTICPGEHQPVRQSCNSFKRVLNI
ncbi:protein of unknown function [Candidatus Methylocalor cossyra]|uniref:Uncharacterized protein n=1 Tax=Candidatus Methylocalor cossyra TaxID=3108543 RepID=A0ABP1CA48_9GAMM